MAMRLTAEEEAMLRGAAGEAAARALRMQVEVGEFFGAEQLVPVSSAHMMAEIESMGEARLASALEACGVYVIDTCINYQTFMPPRFGEHLAWGDTGTVIFANSVAGARTNFEGGPVALAAGITGRTAAYGYHLDAQRRGTALVDVRDRPRSRSDWSALGCAIGRQVSD